MRGDVVYRLYRYRAGQKKLSQLHVRVHVEITVAPYVREGEMEYDDIECEV